MVLRIHGKDESVVRFRQGAPHKYLVLDTIRIEDFFVSILLFDDTINDTTNWLHQKKWFKQNWLFGGH